MKRIVRWYDRRSRNWVVQVLDAEGNQIGDAEFSATKSGAIKSQDFLYREWQGKGEEVKLEKLKPIYA